MNRCTVAKCLTGRVGFLGQGCYRGEHGLLCIRLGLHPPETHVVIDYVRRKLSVLASPRSAVRAVAVAELSRTKSATASYIVLSLPITFLSIAV